MSDVIFVILILFILIAITDKPLAKRAVNQIKLEFVRLVEWSEKRNKD
jgi:hypothetical protein